MPVGGGASSIRADLLLCCTADHDALLQVCASVLRALKKRDKLLPVAHHPSLTGSQNKATDQPAAWQTQSGPAAPWGQRGGTDLRAWLAGCERWVRGCAMCLGLEPGVSGSTNYSQGSWKGWVAWLQGPPCAPPPAFPRPPTKLLPPHRLSLFACVSQATECKWTFTSSCLHDAFL